MEYSIGDLSKITRVSGKKLHQYHLDGLVVPARIDKFSQRRFYNEKSFHRVEVVSQLMKLGLSTEAIKEILARYMDPGNFLKRFRENLKHTENSWEAHGITHETIEDIIHSNTISNAHVDKVEVKVLPDLRVAAKRFSSKPESLFGHLDELHTACNGSGSGNPIILYHDEHQYEDEMDLECCLPVSGDIKCDEITTKELKGTRAVTVQYSGRLSGIWKAYASIVNHLNDRNLAIQSPTREIILSPVDGKTRQDNPQVHIEVQFLTGDPNDPGFNRDISRPGYGINAAFDL